METDAKNKPFQPKRMVDLLPELNGILSKDCIRTLTAVKEPRATMVTRTAVKAIKPLTIAEMRDVITGMTNPTPLRHPESLTSTKKQPWNSSVKVKKTKTNIADGPLKHNPVRKALNFQTKPNRTTVVHTETPKFRKPEPLPKKSLHLQVKTSVRISGVFNMPETPVINNRTVPNRMTMSNKENFAATANSVPKAVTSLVKSKTSIAPPNTKAVNNNISQNQTKPANKKILAAAVKTNTKANVTPLIKKPTTQSVLDTPLSNMSWESGTDSSFLEKEKEIQDIEDKMNVQNNQTHLVSKEAMLENITEESPPDSTSLMEYRNVKQLSNCSNDDSVVYNDSTMCCEKIRLSRDMDNSEDSDVVSLCGLLKASVINPDQMMTELSDLLKVEKQLENNIKMIDNGIKTLTNIKESDLKTLQYVRKLKNEKFPQTQTLNENNNNNIMKAKSMPKLTKQRLFSEDSPVSRRPSLGAKSKSPSYKIPKKNQCLRKKLLYKSMPNVSEGMCTPNKEMDQRALNIYMGMKNMGQMSFLNTPRPKGSQRVEVLDTPTVMSHNLQKQLNSIFRDDT